MRVELLFWAGCPSYERALAQLREILAEEGLDPATIVVREVETESDAASDSFIGSPTIRFDGVDVQPEANEPVGLSCRVYRLRDGRFSPIPDPEDVREALRRARAAAGNARPRAAAANAPSRAAAADNAPSRAAAADNAPSPAAEGAAGTPATAARAGAR